MKCWRCLFSLLFASGCHRETAGLQPYQFECGNPIIYPSTGAPVRPKNTQGIQEQLPKGVAVKDGCWSVKPEGRLEGYFQKDTTDAVYVFEFRDDRWMLVETKAGAVVKNPYALHDNVR